VGRCHAHHDCVVVRLAEQSPESVGEVVDEDVRIGGLVGKCQIDAFAWPQHCPSSCFPSEHRVRTLRDQPPLGQTRRSGG
jgi:hypothetical protein